MNKPIIGIPLRLFQLWLYAPLLLLGYLDVTAFVVNSPKVGWVPLLIGWGMSLIIAWAVLFSREFRQFSRATPFRILCCIVFLFGLTELFVIVWAALNHDLRWSSFMVTVPGAITLLLTPAMVMRFEVLLPKGDEP